MTNYMRVMATINNTPVAIGLLHNGIQLIVSDDDSLYEIPLSEIDEEFYTGIDTAPLYDGCIQYAFKKEDARDIADCINNEPFLQTTNAKVVDDYKLSY